MFLSIGTLKSPSVIYPSNLLSCWYSTFVMCVCTLSSIQYTPQCSAEEKSFCKTFSISFIPSSHVTNHLEKWGWMDKWKEAKSGLQYFPKCSFRVIKQTLLVKKRLYKKQQKSLREKRENIITQIFNSRILSVALSVQNFWTIFACRSSSRSQWSFPSFEYFFYFSWLVWKLSVKSDANKVTETRKDILWYPGETSVACPFLPVSLPDPHLRSLSQ